ncbi:MAG: hypothetical protein JSR21_18780 [Proteobacteria bacterium]|nr:hypothetical protein [Pseudomonadota bacterium]
MLKGSDKETVLQLLKRAAQARRIGDTLSEEARASLREYADQLEDRARAQRAQLSAQLSAHRGARTPPADRLGTRAGARNAPAPPEAKP